MLSHTMSYTMSNTISFTSIFTMLLSSFSLPPGCCISRRCCQADSSDGASKFKLLDTLILERAPAASLLHTHTHKLALIPCLEHTIVSIILTDLIFKRSNRRRAVLLEPPLTQQSSRVQATSFEILN